MRQSHQNEMNQLLFQQQQQQQAGPVATIQHQSAPSQGSAGNVQLTASLRQQVKEEAESVLKGQLDMIVAEKDRAIMNLRRQVRDFNPISTAFNATFSRIHANSRHVNANSAMIHAMLTPIQQ